MARRHAGVALGGECDDLGVRPVGIQLLLTADPGAEIAAPTGLARHGALDTDESPRQRCRMSNVHA
jgi:hypothetical protein